ncbi:clavesin-2-like [Onthophagus taurus]|uniref:clavesin-2-like n=1 Tax=Onthophagus taurus TaxID=166361 RepID=UPI0039BEB405
MSSPVSKVNEEDLEKIAIAFKDNREKLNKYVELFKEWIKSENHLPQDLEVCFIENFIRLCKYDFEKAKSKFESYIITKHSLNHLKPEFKIEKERFERDDISRIFVISPDLTSDLSRIFYLWGTREQSNFDYKSRQKYVIDLVEWFLHLGLNVGTSFVFVLNFDCFTFQLATKLDFAVERRFMNLTVNCLPAIIKQIHCINVPSAAKSFIVLLKSICSEKIRNRIIIHNGIDDLKKFIPSDDLPIELNGTSGKSVEDWAKNWEHFYTQNGEVQEKIKNLHLCGEIPKNKVHLDCSAGFGANGSFRQLQLD